tara:strand:+ start:356 stop:598 length:243 start_codon:yes stop_codon:yes gene_type:complete
MNRRKIQKVLNRFWQSGDNLEKEIIHIDDEKDLINDLFALYGVSHQRELLIAFHKWQQSMWTSPNDEITENVVDVYLKTN